MRLPPRKLPRRPIFCGRSSMTPGIGDTLVHGDYSPKNILLHGSRMVLLDHEVIHWGDPAFDVGFSLTHLLSKAHYLADLRPTFADAARQYWHRYREALGSVDWRDVLGTACGATYTGLFVGPRGRPVAAGVPRRAAPYTAVCGRGAAHAAAARGHR